jgi:organic radical activating enzyme
METIRLLDRIGLGETLTRTDDILRQFKEELGGRKLIIYGASVIGASAYRVMRELGVDVMYIVDRDADELDDIDGFKVRKPESLAEISDLQNYLVLIAASRVTSKSVLSDMAAGGYAFTAVENGEDVTNVLQCAVCAIRHKEGRDGKLADCGICSVLDNQCPVFRKRGEDVIGAAFKDDKKRSKRNAMIGYPLGKVCTLNCRHCCESLPLYSGRQRSFVDTETVKRDIERLASACEYITKVEFIGGEPFLHPGLEEIVQETLEIGNVAFVQIFTNGTVQPSDKLCEIFANERTAVHISDYSSVLTDVQKRRVELTKETLSKRGVSYALGAGKKWFDFSSFEYRDDDDTELSKSYSACFLHHCNRLCDGVLYVCPHHYAGVGLGYIDPCSDTVRIHELEEEELAEALDRFKTMDFAEACRYCKMPWDAPVIPGGE